jgi:hypothetical protein
MYMPRKHRFNPKALTFHKRACFRKRRFSTEYRAQKFLGDLKKRSTYDGKELKVYECSFCRGFHLGHAEPDV